MIGEDTMSEFPEQDPAPLNEPSILDYLKSKLHLTRETIVPPEPEAVVEMPPAPARERSAFILRALPWRSLLAVMLAWFGQQILEPPTIVPWAAVLFYVLAAGMLAWAIVQNEWRISAPEASSADALNGTVHLTSLLIALPLILLTFIAIGSKSHYTTWNVILWGLAVLYTCLAFWNYPGRELRQARWTKVKAWFAAPSVNIHLSGWDLLLLVVLAIVAFFRLYQLNQVPAEMIGDHVETMMDVQGILNGDEVVYSERINGRETLQFYLAALISRLPGMELSFLALKLTTVLAGLATLVFIYRLGKELGGRWVGILALLLAGMGYWANVISRVGLRFAFYPLFAAAVMYYLVRGLKRSNRNDLILAGLALGLGLHGYTPFRIVPFLVAAGVLIYALHSRSKEQRTRALLCLAVIALVSLAVFLPLLRYWVNNPHMYTFRAFSRLTALEQPLPAPALEVFWGNLKAALAMPFWRNGTVWVYTVADRPGLDVISAVFLMLGLGVLIARYAKHRGWQDIFLLLSVPVLMLPSILSLAFPAENPALNRAAGAYVPIYLIAAIGMEGLLRNLFERARGGWGKGVVTLLAVGIFLLAGSQNYRLVFGEYGPKYRDHSWNSSELGAVIRSFNDTVGSPDRSYVVGVPHWVDTRLVAMNAGFPDRDFAIWPDQLAETAAQPGAKIFLVKGDDQSSLDLLKELYPLGALQEYHSQVPEKDFWIFTTPPGE